MTTAMRLVLIATAVLMIGFAATDSGEAKGKGRRPVQSRVATQRQVCESGGGTLTAETYQTIAYTSCSGGSYDGYNCTLTPSKEDCSYQRDVPGDGSIDGVVDGETAGVSDDPAAGQKPGRIETVEIADDSIAGAPTVEETPPATEREDE